MTCTCSDDQAWMRSRRRPAFEEGAEALRLIDLYCGCGGLTLGVAEAAIRAKRRTEVVLAVDSDLDAITTYQRNFPEADARAIAVEKLFDGKLGDRLTTAEHQLALEVVDVDLIVGGPPCQGHSSLNNHTRGKDPRNHLYARMARAVEVLRPKAMLIENVPSVVRDKQDVVG